MNSSVHLPPTKYQDFSNQKRRKRKMRNLLKKIAMIVDILMAGLAGTAEEDVELNRQYKSAINKLCKLFLLKEALSKCGYFCLRLDLLSQDKLI